MTLRNALTDSNETFLSVPLQWLKNPLYCGHFLSCLHYVSVSGSHNPLLPPDFYLRVHK